MSKSLAMDFGADGKVKNPKPGLKLIDAGEINDASTVTIALEPGAFYLLACKEYRLSDGAFRGQRLITITTSEDIDFDTGTVTRGNAYASSNAGVTITNNTGNSITLAQSSATYGFRFALYRMF